MPREFTSDKTGLYLSDDERSHVIRLPITDMEERREYSCGKLLKSLGTIQCVVHALDPPPVLNSYKRRWKTGLEWTFDTQSY